MASRQLSSTLPGFKRFCSIPFHTFISGRPFRNASTSTAPLLSQVLKAQSQTQTSGITQITTLPNGIRVTTENTSGHFSGVGVYIDAGSRYETPRTTGVSHILDRLAFKSTKNRTNEQMQTELESLGGNIMCASGRESISYQAAIFPRDLPRLINVLADVIRNPLILPEEVAEQKQTALYELSEIWQKPEMILPEILHTVAFKQNTLGNPMFCSPENLAIMTPELIKEYIATWYRPERIVVAAAGARHEEVLALAEKHFGDMPKSPDFNAHVLKTSVLGSTKPSSKPSLYKTITTAATSILNPNPPPLPINSSAQDPAIQKSHYTGGVHYIDQPLPHTHVYIAFEGLPIHDPDIYALATLQMLLGGGGSFSAGGPGKGMYSRLFTQVLNQYVWMESCMSFHHCYTDSGLFGIFASCRPEYNHALPGIIAQQFDNISSKGRYALTQEEVNRAKNQLLSSLLMNLESRMVQLEDLGRQVQVHGIKVPVEVMCQKIKEVTLEDLMRVANRVFRGGVVNEGKGTGNVTVVAQGNLLGLPDVIKTCERYGLGKIGLKWLVH